MYGGRDLSGNYYDEIWALSIPAFVWSRLYTGENPRFSHTCHLVGNRTVLTVGGVANADQMRGSGSQACDWEEKSVGILDMTEIKWGSVYNAQAPVFEVPRSASPSHWWKVCAISLGHAKLISHFQAQAAMPQSNSRQVASRIQP